LCKPSRMKYATLHFAFIYMAFINNLRWRNFGLCAKVSMYRAGTSDRVFQRGSIAPSRGDFSSGKLPRGARNHRIYARFVSVVARPRALLLKGEVPISDFHFPARARPPGVPLGFYSRIYTAAVLDMKKEEKNNGEREREREEEEGRGGGGGGGCGGAFEESSRQPAVTEVCTSAERR